MLSQKRIVLDPRLSMIAELVGSCSCYADIGCDHGRLGAFMLQNGICQKALLTDISEPSLNKARRLIGLLGYTDRVRFLVGDGLDVLDEAVEAIVIAGMGGATIAGILRCGRDRLHNASLIMQPNVGQTELRRALCDLGYRIEDERVVPDGRRNYVLIKARPGEAKYDIRQLTVGPVLLERMPESLGRYAAFRLRVAKKALKGAQISVSAQSQADQATLEQEIAIWEEVASCLAQ